MRSPIKPIQYACTLEDVARELNVSRQMAWMIEQRALAKMRRALLRDEARGVELRGLMRLADDLRMRREMRRDGDPE